MMIGNAQFNFSPPAGTSATIAPAAHSDQLLVIECSRPAVGYSNLVVARLPFTVVATPSMGQVKQ